MTPVAHTFRVFVSSTFADLGYERNALQRHVFPRLRELAGRHGHRFQAVDLRWGVSDAASLDQRTMRICMGELERCQDTSPRPNFVLLLGDRYGWRPLPEVIPASEFDAIVAETDGPRQTLLATWYQLDDNAVPAERYLRARAGRFADPATWAREVEQPLRRVFDTVVPALCRDRDSARGFLAAATHQEIHAGALTVPNAREHVFAFFRDIANLEELRADIDRGGALYLDRDSTGAVDEGARCRLGHLRREVEERLGNANVFRYSDHWTGDSLTHRRVGSLPSDLDACLALLRPGFEPTTLCEAVWCRLGTIIATESQRSADQDPVEEEAAAHRRFRAQRARVLMGREPVLARIQAYLQGDVARPLGIFGSSGCGKSALLAGAVQAQSEGPNVASSVVVERFVGATPGSVDIRTLLAGLCREIDRAYGHRELTATGRSFGQLVDAFRGSLAHATAERPLRVFVDALDQLLPSDNAHHLAWLPAILPSHARIVVTTLPEVHDCLAALRRKLPPGQLVELGGLDKATGAQVLDTWLMEARRRLQPEQRAELLDKFSASGSPLFLQLAFEEARRWRSADGVPTYEGRRGLRSDVRGVIGDMLWRLERPEHHGGLMVRRSLGALAAARSGLNEAELLDLLSADPELFESVRATAHHELKEPRLPIILWSRLRSDLGPYLAEHSTSGGTLMAFYHRQLRETVEQRYRDEAASYHVALSDYFGLDGPHRGTVRSAWELPHQLTLAKRWPELERALTDLPFLEGKFRHGLGSDLLNDYRRLGLGRPPAKAAVRTPWRSEGTLGVACPGCQAWFPIGEELLGQLMHCPHCNQSLQLNAFALEAPWEASGPKREPPKAPPSEEILDGPLDEYCRFITRASHVLAEDPSRLVPLALEEPSTSPVMQAVRVSNQPARIAAVAPGGSASKVSACIKTILTGSSSWNGKCLFTPDGQAIAVCDWERGTIRLLDAWTGDPLEELEASNYIFLPDGRALAVEHSMPKNAYDRIRFELRDVGTRETWFGDRGEFVALSPDGAHIAVTDGGWHGGSVRIVEVASGRVVVRPDGGLTMSCAFSPDGRWLFMGNNDEESTVWDLRNRRIAAKLQVPAIAAVFSPDASMLVCISMFCGVLVAYEVGSWTGRRGPRIGDSADAVAFSADGELVAMTKMRGALSVKHLQSGATLLVPEDLSEGVVSSMFSPTDSRLLTVDRDGVARIWDTDLLERTTERPPLPGPPQLAASDEDDEEITEEMLPANGI